MPRENIDIVERLRAEASYHYTSFFNEAADEIERLRRSSSFPSALIVAFEDHYWDTLQGSKDMIMDHVRSVLRQYETNMAIARAHMPKVELDR